MAATTLPSYTETCVESIKEHWEEFRKCSHELIELQQKQRVTEQNAQHHLKEIQDWKDELVTHLQKLIDEKNFRNPRADSVDDGKKKRKRRSK